MGIRIALGTLVIMSLGVTGEPKWWQTMSLYQIYPRSFKDSNGDGIGDLKGVESKLQHLVDSKFDAFWLSPIYPSPMVDFGYDISDFKDVDPVFGTLKDFDDLLKKAHELKLKLILDFVPNHSSDKHEWFQKSVKKIDPYTDYYVWSEGKVVDGVREPPNNWACVFYGSAWEWNEERGEYYLHQFAPAQPDLNYRNKHVVEEMKNVLRFWLDKGVDGFRIDAVPHLFEVEDLRDEPLTNVTSDPKSFQYTNHIYTQSLDETYDMVSQWRAVLEEYEKKDNEPRVMMIEVYANLTKTMDYYKAGASYPFNFGFITSVSANSTAEQFKLVVDNWMENMPEGATANWVVGNHDQARVVTRFGPKIAKAVIVMVQLLPGVAVTYNGDEIGMENTKLTWEQTVDPQGCNAGRAGFEKQSRDPTRTPFQWDSTTSAGFSTNATTWLPVNENYVTVNLEAQKGVPHSNYTSFLKVTEMRQWPSVKHGSISTALIHDDIFAFSRELEGQKSVYVVINLAEQDQSVDLTENFKNVPAKVELYHSTSEVSE
ncbi:hypothetical protein QAD02_016281, partial [Eretmocerus hayati]